MSKKKNTPASGPVDPDQTTAEDPALHVETPPDRESNEALECVLSAAQTISGCTESEVKNFIATADFTLRELAVQLADLWKGVCKTAEKAGKESETAAKVSVAAKIDIDHTNILLMDTVLTTSYAPAKVSRSSERQENLNQTEFKLAVA